MIILDTHIWVRWVDPDANPLPDGILKKIEVADQLAVSAITCWEVAWLVRRNRLSLLPDLTGWLVAENYRTIGCADARKRITQPAKPQP